MDELVESFSGIRGIFGKSLTNDIISKYVFAFLRLLKEQGLANPKIVIGRDTRPSSDDIADIFKTIFTQTGCEIFDVGISSTPATENGVRYFGSDSGVMITASHNPKEYNGFKFLRKDGAVLGLHDAERLIKYANIYNDAQSEKYVVGLEHNKHKENIQAYAQFILDIIGYENTKLIKNQNLTILFDCGGGAIIPFIKPIAKNFGINAILFNDIPGKFNRVIEPTAESLSYLKDEIQKNNADFAVGFDCDSDRAEFILPSGSIVSGQHALAIAVDEILANMDNAHEQTVVVNDVTSDLVRTISLKYDAKVKEVEVGEINVVDEMKKLKSRIGGEGSSGGSIITPQACRDGMLSTLIIAQHIARTKKTLEKIIDAFPKYYIQIKKIKKTPIDDMRDKIEKQFAENGNITSIQKTGDSMGGLKIRFLDNAWLWFRASRTEPGLVRIYAESKNENRAKELIKQGEQILQKI